ncbi:general secretion pathway protein GspA [Vibrio genomosp. F10 str. 9ZD137]|nr:general secretion pathway protein GspA [Vibrio genomosp. F10 str. 9ZD137]
MMYHDFFSFSQPPFSIVPNSRYLFLSQRHKEAIQHLEAGLGEGGGFAMLTGEVGTGKTTVAKVMLANLGIETKAGLILNPTFSDVELLEAICDEFSVPYPNAASLKQLSQAIYQFLLANHAQGIQTLLVIDEAQHLAADVLEQLRLLTNLETDSHKLLKVLLIGQPELQEKLKVPQLRQLAQRITGRYHLLPLTVKEGVKYIQFRLETAGGDSSLFPTNGMKYISVQTQGIPRLINLVCDAALKSAYQSGIKQLNLSLIQQACNNVMLFQPSFAVTDPIPSVSRYRPVMISLTLGIIASLGIYWWAPHDLDKLIDNEFATESVVITPPKITREVFSPNLEQLLMQSSSLEQSIADLYQVWGYQASVLDQLCMPSESAFRLFNCEYKDGVWEDLLALNMPAVLHLDIGLNGSYAVLYRAHNDDTIELLFNDQRVRFDQRWLKSIWTGRYHYVWRSEFQQLLKKGMSGEPISQLDSKLSALLGESASNSSSFDEGLERKVKVFQRWQGIEVDGIAGKQTLKVLELLTQESAPSLQTSTAKELSSVALKRSMIRTAMIDTSMLRLAKAKSEAVIPSRLALKENH